MTIARPSQTPVVVISLKRSEDRRQKITKRLQDLGLEFQFFDAIDGEDFPLELEPMIDRSHKQAKLILALPLSDGEVACALSHALVYKRIIDEGWDDCFILEDDAILSHEFTYLVRQGVLSKDRRIELATLCYGNHRAWYGASIDLGVGLTANRLATTPFSTVGYYLTKSTAIKLYGWAVPISMVADWPAPIHLWPGTYSITPMAVTVSDLETPSTLENGRRRVIPSAASIETWSPKARLVARLLGLSILPCLLWPKIFGDVRRLLWVGGRFCYLMLIYPLTKKIHGIHNAFLKGDGPVEGPLKAINI